jgi:hypothetical protein
VEIGQAQLGDHPRRRAVAGVPAGAIGVGYFVVGTVLKPGLRFEV